MNSNRLSNPDTSTASGAVSDPSRRTFLTKLTTILFAATSAGLLPESGKAWPRNTWYGPYPQAAPRFQYDDSDDQDEDEDEDEDYPPQRSAPFQADYSLNTTVQRYITHLRRTGRLAANEKTAWLVYDFTSRQYLVSINANTPYQSASMIKPLIALAFFHKVRQGKLRYTPFHRARMEAMIQRSNNQATNYFIDLLSRASGRFGPAEAERTLKRNSPGGFRQTRIVERIPGGGRSYRNRASARDYHQFLHALWYDQLPYSGELKRLLHLPKHNRVYTGATGVARQTWVFDKTGTTARLCGDMGILVAQGLDGRRYPYIFIGIIEKSRPTQNYLAWKNARGDVIREVSSLVYGHMRRLHNLV
ncbi:MAG: serine hydrolase [Candidatus Competibacteraceae bacterium]